MGYAYTDFGTLADVENDGFNVWITNTNGDRRKMSVRKYQESATRVYNQAQRLIGQEVRIQTSQNTANWSTSEWFSDIAPK